MAKKTTAQTTEQMPATAKQAGAAIQTETAATTATATVEPAAETATIAAPEVQLATSETAAPEQAASEEVEVAKAADETAVAHTEQAPDHIDAEEPESVTLIDLVRDASERAQKEANHAAHAVLEDLLQAVHGIKSKIDAAVVHLEGEAAEVIAELRDLL